MKKRVLLLSLVLTGAISASAQVSLTGTNPSYSQNFNTLAATGTSSVVPANWAFLETGSSANTTYAAGDGSSNTGNTYSFGTGTNTDRAFGAVASNNLQTVIGASFVNNTGSVVSGVSVTYRGEQWRRGNTTAGQKDSLLFQYSTNASSVGDPAATWTTVSALNFTSINTSTTAGALDGNTVNTTLTGNIPLNLQGGQILWIRFYDVNIVGSDDGLAADDFAASFTTNNGGPQDTLVRFSPIAGSVAENGGSFTLNLTYGPVSPSTAFTARVSLKSGAASDLGNYTTQTIHFAAGVSTATVPVTITDNNILDGNRNYVFAVRGPSGAMIVGNDSLFTLTVIDNETPVGPQVPVYSIATVRGNNTNGGPDSLNVTCELRGTVYGVNLRPNGLEFTLNDGTAGISIFAPANSNTFGYTVHEGDSIRVVGDVITYRGLAQMAFLDTIIPAGPGHVKNPVGVSTLNEFSESNLVRLDNCHLTNPSQWTTGAAAPFNVDCNCGGQAIKIRIHNATTAITAAAPTGTFSVIGIGSQFATSATAPFTDGYQIVPRYISDILYGGGISESDASANMTVFPNPTQGRFFVSFESATTGKAVVALKDLTGRTVYAKNINLVNGTNQIEMNEQLTAGVYLVTIQVGNERAVKRVVVR